MLRGPWNNVEEDLEVDHRGSAYRDCLDSDTIVAGVKQRAVSIQYTMTAEEVSTGGTRREQRGLTTWLCGWYTNFKYNGLEDTEGDGCESMDGRWGGTSEGVKWRGYLNTKDQKGSLPKRKPFPLGRFFQRICSPPIRSFSPIDRSSPLSAHRSVLSSVYVARYNLIRSNFNPKLRV